MDNITYKEEYGNKIKNKEEKKNETLVPSIVVKHYNLLFGQSENNCIRQILIEFLNLSI